MGGGEAGNTVVFVCGGTHRGGRADPCGLSKEDPYQTASIPLDKPYDGCPVENTLSKV